MYTTRKDKRDRMEKGENWLRSQIGEYAFLKMPPEERESLIKAHITSKYHNVSSDYNGHRYHSQKEAQYAFDLDMLLKDGQIKSWTRQVKIPLDINGYHIANYYIDFVVTHNNSIYEDGLLEYVEVKGFVTDLWKMKWKIFEALYGDKPLVKLTIVY